MFACRRLEVEMACCQRAFIFLTRASIFWRWLPLALAVETRGDLGRFLFPFF
uniref:Uncharacterized protein n=1 Tax=Manihot esculenta TaxID=3983 RepID=A0A2C9WI96_MANES